MPSPNLKELQNLFARGVNIIEHLQKQGVDRNKAVEMSYDLQAGTYIHDVSTSYAEYIDTYTGDLSNLLDELNIEIASLMEVGVGEATTLANTVTRLRSRPQSICGFDISWSRIKYAQRHFKRSVGGDAMLFIADLFQMPYADDSIDVVYTSHSIEPNGGRETEALRELYRVARKYLVLLEPSYEMATDEGRAHMERHGYVRGLPDVAKRLGFNVVQCRPAKISARPSNPTAVMVIEKNRFAASSPCPELACPVRRRPLTRITGGYWSESSLLLYPELDGVACLTPRSGVVATHYSDFHPG